VAQHRLVDIRGARAPRPDFAGIRDPLPQRRQQARRFPNGPPTHEWRLPASGIDYSPIRGAVARGDPMRSIAVLITTTPIIIGRGGGVAIDAALAPMRDSGQAPMVDHAADSGRTSWLHDAA